MLKSLQKIGWTGVAATVIVWYIRRSHKQRRRKILKRRGNNGEVVNSPDKTGAEALLLTNSQNVELYVRFWRKPYEAEMKGSVLLFHSYSWHSEYLVELAELLLDHRYGVIAFDLQGHGLSGTVSGQRGDIYRYQDLLADSDRILQFSRDLFPHKPLFVLGEGFGASLTLHLSLKHEQDVEGMILCGPFVMTSTEGQPPLHIRSMLTGLERLMPDLKISPSEDKTLIVHQRSDPLFIHNPTLRFFIQAHECLKSLEKDLTKIRIPFLTIHGDLDSRAPSKHSRELFVRAGTIDKQIMIFEYMHGRLLQESPEYKTRVFNEIVVWLDQRSDTHYHISKRDPKAPSGSSTSP